MTSQRLADIISGFQRATVAVVGDFFLDEYLETDPALSETSLETGLEARQVVNVRCQPGAAGTVVANLCALGVGEVLCVGFVGDDGAGFELLRGLKALGVDTTGMVVRDDRFTPTYRKPLVRLPQGGVRELERLDTKNRDPVPAALDEALVARVRELASRVDAVIVQDQVEEPECGVITARMRQALASLAEAHPKVVWFGDSRVRVGEYRNLILKPNREECCQAVHPDAPAHAVEEAKQCAAALAARARRPVFLTLGVDGMAVAAPDSVQTIPTIPLSGEIDIVGAGDSATAGIVSALSSGATMYEAAIVGNIVASITIEQIGTTGVATREQVVEQFARTPEVWETLPPPLSLA
jgi:rfaE bifunctional protein kinase chain/domain